MCARFYRVTNKDRTQLSTLCKKKKKNWPFQHAWQFAFTLVGLAYRPMFSCGKMFESRVVPVCGA